MHVGEDVVAMFTKAVAVYFRELRERQGFTQESLAETAKCGKRTVERLERREGPISVASLERLIAVLGASPDEVNYLMTNDSATDDEARELAQALLRREPTRRWATPHEPASVQDPGLIGIQAYVQTLRERQGISRKALADTLGVGIATYANWEAGRGTMMPFPVLVRLTTQVGGTLEDLERISLASEGHEELGKRLADQQLAAFQMRQSAPRQQRDSAGGAAYDGKVLRRITAIEGVLHALLGLLKRLLPDAAEEIERTSVLWFQRAAMDDEGMGRS
jgi:transcriptional regulator with XRE-family HTH domain